MMEHHHAKLLGRCAAYPLVMRGLSDLAAAGHWSTGGPPVNWSDEVLWAEAPGGPVGVIVYRLQEHYEGYFINLGYVLPGFRRRGVYRALWDELVVRARDKGMVKIVGATSIGNIETQRAMEAMGRTAREIVYGFDIPPAPVAAPPVVKQLPPVGWGDAPGEPAD